MYEKFTLKNGLRIVMDRIPSVRSISFGIWVGNGSRNEEQAENGISHFIEHMLFKGTEHRAAKEIADEIDAIGGQLNAGTSKETTYYYVRVLDTHFDKALDIVCDMFFNSRFDNSDIEKERNVIIEEINMYEDTPDDLVHDLMQSGVWKGESLGQPILGTVDSISDFDQEKLRDYFKRHYCPENTVVSVAGNFETEDMLKKLESYFSGFGSSKDAGQNSGDGGYSRVFLSTEKDIEQVHLAIAFPSIARGSEQSYVLNVMDLLFGGGMSSRLFQTIREERGMCYSIYSHNASFRDRGLFSIYMGLSPGQVEEAVKLVLNEIDKIKNEPVSEKQLERTKEQLKSNYILSLESSSNRMSRIGNSELLLNKILSPDELLQKIDEVNTGSFRRLANEILAIDKMSISAVGKVKSMNLEKMIK